MTTPGDAVISACTDVVRVPWVPANVQLRVPDPAARQPNNMHDPPMDRAHWRRPLYHRHPPKDLEVCACVRVWCSCACARARVCVPVHVSVCVCVCIGGIAGLVCLEGCPPVVASFRLRCIPLALTPPGGDTPHYAQYGRIGHVFGAQHVNKKWYLEDKWLLLVVCSLSPLRPSLARTLRPSVFV